MSNTTALFDVATIADCIKKANRVCPTKGAAFDQAQGIIMEVGPEGAVIKSTNTYTTYKQVIPVAKFEGPPAVWRIPNVIFANVLAQMPMGSGRFVEFVDRKDSHIRFRCETFVGRLPTINSDSFPKFDSFTQDGFEPANDFASRVDQVAWSASKDKSQALGGVRIDGENIYATDRYCISLVPCVVPLSKPITAPVSEISALLKSASDVKIKASDTKLLLWLDAETCATSLLFRDDYPNILAACRDDFTHEVSFHKETFLEKLNRMLVVVRGDTAPRMEVTITESVSLMKEMILDIDTKENRFQDAINIEVDGEFDQFSFHINPSYLLSAVQVCKGDIVTLKCGSTQSQPQNRTIAICDETGYQCHIVPVRN